MVYHETHERKGRVKVKEKGKNTSATSAVSCKIWIGVINRESTRSGANFG